jgi:TPP-dependent pyruvate/acetoin dehydrogenase alpha subunit
MPTKVNGPLAAASAAGKHGGSLISDAKFKQLYATMLKCRLLQERGAVLLKPGKSSHALRSAIGEEATYVGAAIDLRPTDWIVPAAGDLLVEFMKGVPLGTVFSHLQATSRREQPPAQEGYALLNILPTSSTVAAQFDRANGVALANRSKKKGSIVMAFANDDPGSSKSYEEALKFAGLHSLPVLFIVQQRWRESPAKERTSLKRDTHKAERYGLPVMPVDGKDVVAMYRVAYESIQKARRGGGPTLIEAKMGDVSPNLSGVNRRIPKRSDSSLSVEPINKMEEYLISRNLFSSNRKQRTIEIFERELEVATRVADGARQE